MDWTTITTSVLALIFGGGWLSTLLTAKSTKKKAELENENTTIEQWKGLYTEQRQRNQTLETKVDKLQEENKTLLLENERLKAKIEQNTEDIKELQLTIKALKESITK